MFGIIVTPPESIVFAVRRAALMYLLENSPEYVEVIFTVVAKSVLFDIILIFKY
tara:strand:- start:139 stop:300 length:162 start_codon:yes stop_codon:yes gene_type:complete